MNRQSIEVKYFSMRKQSIQSRKTRSTLDKRAIQEIRIFGGHGRDGTPELVSSVILKSGQIISVVGPTGSGKTELINDIERFADRNTPSGRKITVDGKVVTDEESSSIRNPVALITQHTNFLSDLPVHEFLSTHARVRSENPKPSVIGETLSFANELTGEPIRIESIMTELSGGQTRALLIADAIVIGNAPIVLLDEIENAGINKTRALELIKPYGKICMFVTHDPKITLQSDIRIVMKNGAMQRVITRDSDEKYVLGRIAAIDDLLLEVRSRIREGERIDRKQFAVGWQQLIAFGKDSVS